jgi:hypothetical protein
MLRSIFKNTLSFFTIVVLFGFTKHPFFVGVTQVEYKSEEKLLQVSAKLFFDDFEAAVKKDLNLSSLNIVYPKDSALVDLYIKTYFLKHFTILENNKPISLNYLGYEIQKEAAWVYLEAENCELPKKMSIMNTLLCEYTDKQNNIIQLKGFPKEQNKNMNCENTFWLIP